MEPQEPLKDEQIRVRVPGELKARVARAYDLYGVSEATLVRDSLEGILAYIERSGGYRRPVRMEFDEAGVGSHVAAEDAATYPRAMQAERKPPKAPPDKTQRSRGGGPAHRVPKSA